METDRGFCVNLIPRGACERSADGETVAALYPQAVSGHHQHGNTALPSYKHHTCDHLSSLISTCLTVLGVHALA